MLYAAGRAQLFEEPEPLLAKGQGERLAAVGWGDLNRCGDAIGLSKCIDLRRQSCHGGRFKDGAQGNLDAQCLADA